MCGTGLGFDKEREVRLERYYRLYRERIDTEHRVLNHRVTWMLVAQGLLFVAYMSGAELSGVRDPVRPVVEAMVLSLIPVAGLCLSLLVVVGCLGAAVAEFGVRRRYALLVSQKDERPVAVDSFWRDFGGMSLNVWLGLVPPLFLPLFFAALWTYVLHLSAVEQGEEPLLVEYYLGGAAVLGVMLLGLASRIGQLVGPAAVTPTSQAERDGCPAAKCLPDVAAVPDAAHDDSAEPDGAGAATSPGKGKK